MLGTVSEKNTNNRIVKNRLLESALKSFPAREEIVRMTNLVT